VLDVAAMSNHQDVVKHLLCQKVQLHRLQLYSPVLPANFFIMQLSSTEIVVDNNGNKPLHLVALNGNVKAAEALLLSGVSIDCKNNDNYTPLHLASSQGT
jgi:ankyrin repeat protein